MHSGARMFAASPLVRGHVMESLFTLVRSLGVEIPAASRPIASVVARLPYAWVDDAHFLDTLYAAAQRHGDFAFRAGYVAAKSQLSGDGALADVLLAARSDVGALAHAMSACFTGLGELVCASTDPMCTTFVHQGECSPTLLRYLTGWLTAGLEAAGARVTALMSMQRMPALGTHAHALRCAWSREPPSSPRGATLELLAAT
ncbi:MAG: hypothetical protein JNK45_24290 [Myxococcales bacterium]|nr:hypothetical protein [Myxococcales bacterium]